MKSGVFESWRDFGITALFCVFVLTLLVCGAVLLVRLVF